jgi:cytochrome c-type biogenesis protein CcmH/NrfG
MRRAAIHADGEMDPARAIAVLRTVIELDPTHQDAYYVLAQQHFLCGRYADARPLRAAPQSVRRKRPARASERGRSAISAQRTGDAGRDRRRG